MTRGHKFDYWKESLECALEEAGAAGALTAEQIDRVAGSLEVSAENQDMAFGHDAIPNPLAAEVKAAESRLESQRAEASEQESELRKVIANLRYKNANLEDRLARAITDSMR